MNRTVHRYPPADPDSTALRRGGRGGCARAYAVRLKTALAFVGLLMPLVGSVRAQQEQAVLKGAQYLRGRAANQQVGESAMIALALIKAEVPKNDPVITSCIAKIMKRFTGSGYDPERKGGPDVYEAAVVAMALANMDSEEYRGPLAGKTPMDHGITPTARTETLQSPSMRSSASGSVKTPELISLHRSGTGPRHGTYRRKLPAEAGIITEIRRRSTAKRCR
jgi:hypothetical protein